jgi:predicted small metal-binding protein
MDKKLSCRDMDLECESSVCGKTEEEVLRKAGEHAQSTHAMQGFSQELYNKARAAIREGYCDPADEEQMISEACGVDCCC